MLYFDTECYKNYFLITVTDGETVWRFERYNDEDEGLPIMEMFRLLQSATIVGFNSRFYDLPMIAAAIHGYDNATLKAISDEIIQRRRMPWDIEREYQFRIPNFDHIDVMQVCPLKASLKLYAARIGAPNLEELPVPIDAAIDDEKRERLRTYCINDCDLTRRLYNYLRPQIQLREKIGELFPPTDYRSLGDAQVAEAIYKSVYRQETGNMPPKPPLKIPGEQLYYTPPDYIEFDSPHLNEFLQELRETPFLINHYGYIDTPDMLRDSSTLHLKNPKGRVLSIGGVEVVVGIGGLHSVDAPDNWVSTPETMIVDVDVTSYYPNIILRAGVEPVSYKGHFTSIYQRLLNMRVEAKRNGNEVMNEALKISLNGTFGKLGSSYSTLYSPELLLFVTLTGQLSLMMLLEHVSGWCLSVNTDGLTLRLPRDELPVLQGIVSEWESKTGYRMEYTEYKLYARRDVNNYFAVKMDGSVKRKGAYAEQDIRTNPQAPVCTNAVANYFSTWTDIADYIMAETDPLQFMMVRTCKEGATWNGIYIGKALRWYYTTGWDAAPLVGQKTGRKVGRSDGCKPMMKMDNTVPFDLDRDKYIEMADKILREVKWYL